MVLVREPWYETPGSPDLSFTLNRPMSFPGVLKLGIGVSLCGYSMGFLNTFFFVQGKDEREDW